MERLLKIVDYLIVAPGFNDNVARCYSLPNITCELFCSDVIAISRHLINEEVVGKGLHERMRRKRSEMIIVQIQEYPLLDKIVSYFNVQTWYKLTPLNVTLAGYIHKIISFWLIKRPEVILTYLMQSKNFIQNLFCHLNLSTSVTDILVRLCTMPNIERVDPATYQTMRAELIQYAINALDHYQSDDFITQQIMELFSTIIK